MKNLIVLLFVLCFTISDAHALKVYSYDSDGNRVYQTVQSRYQTPARGNRVLSYRRTADGRISVYDANGNKLRGYRKGANGKTYVYDGNGNRIRSYKTTANGKTYVYNAQGQRIRTYSRTANGNTYVYEAPYTTLNGSSSRVGGRTFVTTNSRAYGNQFKGNHNNFSSRPAGGGTSIVSTPHALYRYGR